MAYEVKGLTRRSFGRKLRCASFAPNSFNVGARVNDDQGKP